MPDYGMMRSYLSMITAGQFVEAEKYYTDDVKVHIMGDNVASGDYVGHEDYTAAMTNLMSRLDSLTVEEHDLLVSDDHAVVLSTWNVTRNGETTELPHVIVYHTQGDKISDLWIIPVDAKRDAAVLS